jgi:uncharacterized protein
VRLFVPILLVLFLLPSLAFGGQFEDGKAAYDHGDYQTALKLLQPLADHGNAEAQWRIGSLYQRGKGVKRDVMAAENWYSLAANQGNAEAEYRFGMMYDGGQVVPQDYKEAYFWYSLAEAQTRRPDYVRRRISAGDHLTPEQKAPVEKRVAEWKKAHPAPAEQ